MSQVWDRMDIPVDGVFYLPDNENVQLMNIARNGTAQAVDVKDYNRIVNISTNQDIEVRVGYANASAANSGVGPLIAQDTHQIWGIKKNTAVFIDNVGNADARVTITEVDNAAGPFS